MSLNFNKKIVQKNFARAAKSYDEYALVQQLAAEKLCSFIAPFVKDDSKILDLGSGTGFVTKSLNALPSGPRNECGVTMLEVRTPNIVTPHSLRGPLIYEVDLALEMLTKNKNSHTLKTQADIEHLPFKPNSFDIIISSFSLQWLTDFEKNFSHFHSLLKPEGIFAFCLPSAGSLEELKMAEIFKFNQIPQIENLRLSLQNSGFVENLFHKETIRQEFVNGFEALKSLKKIGANHTGNANNLVTKSQLRQFDNFCLKKFRAENKNIFTSWIIPYFISSKVT